MNQLKWSDNLTQTEKELYMAQLAVMQLTDHITSGADTNYCVYYDGGSSGATKDYRKALEIFDSLSENLNPKIMLWCRIGTAVMIKCKGETYE